MDSPLLHPEIQDFIARNLIDDVSALALRQNPFPGVSWPEILNQIRAKAKAKEKLPSWFSAENILYPEKISIEQASSEKTAAYKASLVSGESLIDLTGGFGVDDVYFARKINQVVHCEINPELSAIVAHNCSRLQVQNIEFHTGDSYEVLRSLQRKFDWIYIDPSRRNDAKGKVFMLKDCLPNVPELLPDYFSFSGNILIKTAPILDIAAGLPELKNVKAIHIVAVDNEVKELLWHLEKGHLGAISIKTVNLSKDKTEQFDFVLGENDSLPEYGLPLDYLYEPNAAIMKSGAFDEIAMHFNLAKLHRHSHLYTSAELIAFPGRIFEIRQVISYAKGEMRQFLENKKANITTRNFPDSVETIRKKWKIKDGGSDYCFFTTDKNNNKIALICSKIQ